MSCRILDSSQPDDAPRLPRGERVVWCPRLAVDLVHRPAGQPDLIAGADVGPWRAHQFHTGDGGFAAVRHFAGGGLVDPAVIDGVLDRFTGAVADPIPGGRADDRDGLTGRK